MGLPRVGLAANYGAWSIKDYNDSHGADQSYAVFAEASYFGVPKLRLTAGLRVEWNRATTRAACCRGSARSSARGTAGS